MLKPPTRAAGAPSGANRRMTCARMAGSMDMKSHNVRQKRAELLASSNENRAEEATFIFHKYQTAKGGLTESDLLRRSC